MRLLSLALSLLVVACGGATGSGAADAGADGSCGPPPPLHCASQCGTSVGAECIDGAWVCAAVSDEPCRVDSGGGDASVPADAGIECNGLTCNAATQYCDIRGGGAQPLDGGSNVSMNCLPLPAMPCEAGTGCACIPNTCSCTDEGGAIKNECFYP